MYIYCMCDDVMIFKVCKALDFPYGNFKAIEMFYLFKNSAIWSVLTSNPRNEYKTEGIAGKSKTATFQEENCKRSSERELSTFKDNVSHFHRTLCAGCTITTRQWVAGSYKFSQKRNQQYRRGHQLSGLPKRQPKTTVNGRLFDRKYSRSCGSHDGIWVQQILQP